MKKIALLQAQGAQRSSDGLRGAQMGSGEHR